MPGQLLFQPNPPPDPSQLPNEILDFRVQLNTKNVLTDDELRCVRAFRAAADYIAAGQSRRVRVSGSRLQLPQP